MAFDYFKGFTKVRRTKGTKIYYVRNYIALATLGIGIVSGVLMCFSQGFQNFTSAMNEDWFTTPEDRKRKRYALNFGQVPTSLEEKISEITKKQG